MFKMDRERKFAKNLPGLGSAARVRETVSVAVKETSSQNKPKLIEPLDYENVIVKNRTILHNDPQREMLVFPHDDISQSTLPRRFRTMHCSVPSSAIKEASSLLVKECVKTYTSSWNVIHYKYSAFSGSYLQLPRADQMDSLPEQVFEVDAEVGSHEEETALKARNLHITKQGWLFKGPDSSQESSIISFTRSFKRRYFYLKQQADTTYVLEFHKDDKKLDAKGAVFLDSAVSVVKSSKRGKHAFEVHMQEKIFYVFAAETEAEMDDWVKTLKKVIQTNETSLTHNRDAEQSPVKTENFRESLEHSMNPELQKYARETDSVLKQQRKENRQKLFRLYPDVQQGQPSSVDTYPYDIGFEETHVPHQDLDETERAEEAEVYKEQFGTRFILRCEHFRTRLQANLAEEGQTDKLINPEPFFLVFALYDAKEGRKLSEDVVVDLNCSETAEMIPRELLTLMDRREHQSEPDIQGLDQQWLAYPKQLVFSVTNPHSEVYLVARIEKVLQGSIGGATEPYMKTPDFKVGTKLHKQMRQYCSRLGHYRMPFAWGARPIFKPFTKELDTYSDFALYKSESSKICEEELIKHLQEIKKPEKQGKWQSIYGSLKVNLFPFKNTLQSTVTSSLLPVKPFTAPPQQPVALEVEEFVPEKGSYSSPHTTYKNLLYVYPYHLKYDGQKNFPKARNISCSVELRDSDIDPPRPLKRLRGRPGGSLFSTSCVTAVIHHNTTPDYIEEVKVVLPTQLTDKHHLVFTLHHVSCDLSKASVRKSMQSLDNVVGYAWLPLHNTVRDGGKEHSLRVATTLPSGYLSHEQLGLNKGVVGPEIRFVDGGRPVLKIKLRLVSTVYTKDQHLHNFFAHCQRTDGRAPATADFENSNRLKHVEPVGSPTTPPPTKLTVFEKETLTFVKSLHAVEVTAMINFLPSLLNQLFRLLQETHSEEVALNAVRVLIHVVNEVHGVGKPDILHTYVKYVFLGEASLSSKQSTVHEELAKHLKTTLRPAQADPLVVGKFLKHSWFFFETMVKSMAQHLLSTGRIKMARNERFPSSYQFHVQTLVQTLVSHIIQKFKESLTETRNANTNLANFVKKCFTYMDRGFVYRLINMYIDQFSPGDPKLLHEYKFEFLRIVCSHEHYIPLNLPLMRKQVKTYKDLKHDYTLSDGFRRNHFLVGLLLQEVKAALNEIRDIRKFAITTLRNLLAKHAFDNRYSNKAQQARIANLYLPFITVILENKSRLEQRESLQASPSVPNGELPSHSLDTASRVTAISSYSSSVSLDASNSGVTRTVRDPSVFNMISGQVAAGSVSSGDVTKLVRHGSSSSLGSNASSSQSSTLERDSDSRGKDKPAPAPPVLSHQRAQSTGTVATSLSSQSPFVVRYDKLDQKEIKDLLLCFLYIVKNLSEEILLGWFNNSSEYDVLDFLATLEICMQHFKYLGRKRITSLCIISDSRRAQTLPGKRPPSKEALTRANSAVADMQSETLHGISQSEADAMYRAMMEANLSSEVALVVLDVVSLYTNNFKDQLQYQEGENPIMHKVFDLHLYFLQTNQSESIQKHAFAALRAFIGKFSSVLFLGDAGLCGRLCYEILRCCNSRLNSTRSQACAIMYLLMRSNFEFFKRKSFTRVHLQMIIAVSQLISDVVGLNNSRFIDSLSIINSYANNDKAMQRTSFPVEVKDLTKRIRTVLMATAQMKEHQNDPEMLVDLQYSLAKSYASTPELRKTWLDSMARIHVKNGDYSEAAHCYIHIAALVAEYLRRRGEFPQGCQAFKCISPNVQTEESAMKDDAGMQDVQYTEDHLTELLEQCAVLFEKAERYELLGDLYRLIIPIYEKKRNFDKLAGAYEILHRAYSKVVEVMQSGRRLLGKYFRVAFYGQSYFEEEDGKEYIYKEPKITGLPEICERLHNMYGEKYGRENIKLIKDSNKVDVHGLDPKYAYIQVTYVTPYFDPKELRERQTEFEHNNNIRQFMYETPFTKDGKARGQIEEQYKRRTVLTTSHSFPYVKKRILVVYHNKEEVLTPIEVAIDEMQHKVSDLQAVVSQQIPDVKKLQLKLQGSVSVQVNAGPLAYAETFLAEPKVHKYKREKTEALKDVFRKFVVVCNEALVLNGRLIFTDQFEYQESLRNNLRSMADRLSEIFGEQLLDDDDDDDKRSTVSHRSSITVFNVISATGNTSSV